MSEFLKCAIAGLGRIGSSLEKDSLREKPASHAGAIHQHPRTILAAGADPDKDCREEFSTDWPGVKTYEDPAEMIQIEKPQIFHIASWTETHPELLQTALEYQVPVIVCEKPLANSIDEIQSVIKSARSSNTRVLMNHERRFSKDYLSVREMIRSGRFGELISINSRLYMGRKRPVRNVIYHDGTHMLDVLRFLTDKELKILSTVGDAEVEGGGLFVTASAGNTKVNLEISGGRDHLVFESDLSFSSGRIRIGNGTYEIWASEESPYYSGFRSLGLIQGTWPEDTDYFSGMMDHAVKLALDPELHNESSLEDGFIVLKMIRNILGYSTAEETD